MVPANSFDGLVQSEMALFEVHGQVRFKVLDTAGIVEMGFCAWTGHLRRPWGPPQAEMYVNALKSAILLHSQAP